jgi:CMP-N-acetylneuraminic acid synthetase|tara:strand:+ start:7180 stop:7728 length:549 start_codon:yes stop_codon:yes gene_type:complete
MIAKGSSTRLANKNTLDFCGKPLYQWNLQKLLNIFSKVVFDSDNIEMLDHAKKVGAIPHKREEKLLGDEVPSVPIFQSIIKKFPEYSFMINVQANSPTISNSTIKKIKNISTFNNVNEILTMFSDFSINGAVWGISRYRLDNYGCYYTKKPDALILDTSQDIHTQEEFDSAQEFHFKNNKDN